MSPAAAPRASSGTLSLSVLVGAARTAEFNDRPVGGIVNRWCASLKAEGLEASYIYALHARLAQVFTDAVEDGLVARSPCSRRTSPPMGRQKPYVPTTEQVWAVYDAMPDHLRPAILLGAFLGSRVAEACGLRVDDLDLMRGVWVPSRQYPDEPLKTNSSVTPVAFSHTLALELATHVQLLDTAEPWFLRDQWGHQLAPWTLQRAVRAVRASGQVPGLPESFSFHDLRHYYASMLIAGGADLKKVQAALRHASAKTTLDTYGHLWPDSDETIRAVGDEVLQARIASRRAATEA